MNLGHVKECHNPHNELCPNNRDPIFDCTCTCERKRSRKPYREIRVTDPTVPRQHKAKMVLRVHPCGLMEFREHGRRKVYSTTVGEAYHGLIWQEARRVAFQKRRQTIARRAKKGGRK